MPAYVIAEVDVTDAKIYDEYRAVVGATIERYGGRFLVRGGRVDALEGGWSPSRLVVVEFPSLERAREWYRSPEYAPALALRLKSTRTRLLIAEGVAP